jgi:sporulation protein YlmC with PRC-barrel domain
MSDVLAENLSGKSVMGSDGSELGMLYNITMNLKTGRLSDLVVEPQEDSDRGAEFPMDDDGRYRIPVGRIQAAKDHIVVQR